MSSLSVSNFIDITRSNDAPIRKAVILITFSSARVHGRRTTLGIRRRSTCAAYFIGLSAITEPTSKQRNDEADKHFQTCEADSCAGGERLH
jgi:hypothetical protein